MMTSTIAARTGKPDGVCRTTGHGLWTTFLFLLLITGHGSRVTSSSAQTPSLINYQGRLLNGTNLVNGAVGLSLRLFDANTGGTMLYEDSNTVTVADGLYSTFLGDHTTTGSLQAAVATSSNVWIEAAVNGVALVPRERLASVPYALNVEAGGIVGTISDAQLSTNVARLNGTNQTFSGPVNFSSASNTFKGSFTGSFSGNAGGLTNLNLAGIVADGQLSVFAWGGNFYGQTTVPATATGVVTVASGNEHSLALRADGTVIAWGYNGLGVTTVPATATGVVAIAGGSYHSLALRADGTVIAWGNSGNGQTTVPATATGVVAIAGGGAHSLALRGDGTVIAWGYSGNGLTTVPATATGVVAIACGGAHSLALRGDGTVIAWGDNVAGQATVPATATGVVAIAGGLYHSLALRSDGTVIAWGDNGAGQATVPATATGLVAIAAGGSHSLALRADGTILAWGWNFVGQANVPAGAKGVVIAAGFRHNLVLGTLPVAATSVLARLDAATNTFAGTVRAGSFNGDGSMLANIGPGALATSLATNLATLNGPNQTFSGPVSFSSASNTFSGTFSGNGIAVTNVRLNSLAVDRSTVVAWGYNGAGQTNVPTAAADALAVASGNEHSLALRADGTVIAWGNNIHDQLFVPPNATGVVAIAGGGDHCLALCADGSVIAWGQVVFGETTVPASATGVVAIAGGGAHSLALRADGTVIGWGYNDFGQATAPTNATGVVAIAGGGFHSLALRGDGTVIGWGADDFGQATAPTNATNVVAIAGGYEHSLALRADGTVIAWGRNSLGQGDVPAAATGVVAIAGGGYHSLALRADGTVIAWGYNGNGQATVPASATGVVAIAGGFFHSLALRSYRTPAAAVLPRLDAATNTFAGTVRAGLFAGDGSGLTNLSVSVSSLPGGIISNIHLSASVLTNISARLDSNVWNAANASLLTNISARLASNVWVTANAALLTNIAARLDSNVWAAAQADLLASDAALSNATASLATNVAARLASNAWATADSTTNYVSRTGDTMSGNLHIASLANTPGFRVSDGTTNGNVGIQALSGGNSGFSAINFNGFYSGSEQRYTTNKVRWRIVTDQRGSTDRFSIDRYNGTSTTTDFAITTNGHVGIGTLTPTNKLQVGANGAYSDGLSWVSVSDGRRKENFEPLDPAEVLEKITAMPVTKWNYKEDPAAKHIGPTAQDFHAAFGLGANDTSISSIDPAGVALAAIQALNAKLERENRMLGEKVSGFSVQVSELEEENKVLREELDAIKRKLGL